MEEEKGFAVFRLDGTELGRIASRNELDRWVTRRRSVTQQVRIHSSERLPAINGGRDRKFKQVEQGILNIGHPVPGVVVKFLSTDQRSCYALIPFDLTTPA